MGIDILGPVGERAKTVATNLVSQGTAFVRDSMDDLRTVFMASGECLARLDDVRTHLTHRAVQNLTRTVLLLNDLIPLDAMDKAWARLEARLRRDPNPRFLLMSDPKEVLYSTNNIKHSACEHLIDSFKTMINEHHGGVANIFLFVHGANWGDGEFPNDKVQNEFVGHFEDQARIFADGNHDSWLAYVVWDSFLTDEDENLILLVLGALMAGGSDAVGASFIWGVFWRELERRARVVSEFLEPYYRAIILSGKFRGPDVRVTPIAITHSIGSFIWSDMINRLAREGFLGREHLGGMWWSMEAAIPTTAYQKGQMFDGVLKCYSLDNEFFSMRNWYNNTDAVLATAYVYAQHGVFAMGQVGSGQAEARDLDVTSWAKETHGETKFISPGGYFAQIGAKIREYKQKDFDPYLYRPPSGPGPGAPGTITNPDLGRPSQSDNPGTIDLGEEPIGGTKPVTPTRL